MNAVEMIDLFGNLFYVSLAVALVGLALAVFFFFYFDIPTVYALMTGKAKEDTIRRMAEQNAKTGNLRNQYIHTGPTGTTGKTKGSGNTGALTENVSQHQVQAPQSPAAGQPVPLAEPERYETSVLQTPVQETTILNEAAGETVILGSTGTYEPQAVAPVQMPGGFRFDVTESTLVIHTDEII